VTAESIFRREALEHHRQGQAEGRVLRIAPDWIGWAYWIVVLAGAAALLFVSIGTVNEYATGAAVVRIDGRTDLRAKTTCTVGELLAKPGERVRAGQELVRFYVAQEAAEFARVQKEQDGLVLRLLRDPSDQAARTALTTIQAQLDLARARVAERVVVAPRDGVVTDVRVRAGQALQPGDALMTMSTEATTGRILVMIPAEYRPLLRAGTPLRLELNGFRFAYQDLRVDSVGDEAVGPTEVKRYLGPDDADTVSVQGPVVLVQATLPTMAFSAKGETFQYYDGMIGSARVRLRTESILSAIVPGVRDLFRRGSRG
jgi:membrane fusion protein (multidrug efflux system)